ncbi:MAG: TetR/AcrR family transcriptional regulator [Nocardiopsaceae bacterium]|nr:TetR/AcrR family transcriptional regulator [Nocardiopsaceae bacterium]
MSTVRGPGAAHDERRREVLEAVFTIVDTEGTDHVSIRRVADTAGVSVGRVQHYFPTKEELLSAAFTAINDRGTARVHQRLPMGEGEEDAGDPRTVLQVVLGELIPRDDDDRRFFRIAQAFETYAQSRPHLRSRLTQGYDELASLLALLLRLSVRPHAGDEPESDSSPFRTEAYGLLALTIGLAGLVVTENLGSFEAQSIVSTRLDETLGTLRANGS